MSATGTESKPSPISGLGLFTTRAFTTGERIAAYGGAQLASWTAWVAPAAMKPADAAKRVGMTEAELRSIEPLFGIPEIAEDLQSKSQEPRIANHTIGNGGR